MHTNYYYIVFPRIFIDLFVASILRDFNWLDLSRYTVFGVRYDMCHLMDMVATETQHVEMLSENV